MYRRSITNIAILIASSVSVAFVLFAVASVFFSERMNAIGGIQFVAPVSIIGLLAGLPLVGYHSTRNANTTAAENPDKTTIPVLEQFSTEHGVNSLPFISNGFLHFPITATALEAMLQTIGNNKRASYMLPAMSFESFGEFTPELSISLIKRMHNILNAKNGTGMVANRHVIMATIPITVDLTRTTEMFVSHREIQLLNNRLASQPLDDNGKETALVFTRASDGCGNRIYSIDRETLSELNDALNEGSFQYILLPIK